MSRKQRLPLNSEQKEHLSQVMRGKPKTDEARKAIGAGIRAYWAERKRQGIKRERTPETIRKWAKTMMGKKQSQKAETT